MQHIMKIRHSLAIFLLAFTFIAVADHSFFPIVQNGKSEAVIVMQQSDETVNNDAKLFATQVEKSTGAVIPVVTTPIEGKLNIVLNLEERCTDKRDAFSITFPNATTMLIYGTRNSIAYAFDYILERYFRVRRLIMNYDDSRWQKRPEAYSREFEVAYETLPNVNIPCTDVMQDASFNFKRSIYTHVSGWKTRVSFPGTHDIAKWAFPPSKYADDDSWPQEILPIHNGKRYEMKKWGTQRNPNIFKVGWQPCWSNPKTAEIAVENILQQLAASKKENDIYSINLDINDGGGCCQCDKCLAAVGGKLNSVSRMDYSNLYWKWINDIAEEVTKKYPELFINCLAYREVLEPPDFSLHPNVIPQICRELTAVQNPAARKSIEALLSGWSQKARTVFLWDYQYGPSYYLFPRIYFHQQAKLFKMAYQYNVRGVFIEGNDFFGMEGPKHYINAKLLWNVNDDVDDLLKDWCESYGGKAAAPFLMEYYKFWEDYWQRPEIQKTGWFSSSTATYMQLGEQGTYTYALQKGDMAKLRKLVESAANAAETPMQKKRTALLRDYVFPISKNAAKCLFSEFLQPDGSLKSIDDAIALLKSVPDATNALNALKMNGLTSSRILSIAEGGLISNINTITPFLTDSKVQTEIQRLAEMAPLPTAMKTQFKIMLGAKFPNLIENGSFEDQTLLPQYTRQNMERASDGKSSIKFHNNTITIVANGIKPSKTYYIAVDVFADNLSGEGKFSLHLAPRVEKTTTDWKRLKDIKLRKGWQTVSFAYQVPEKNFTNNPVDNFILQICANNFEADEPLWIDNARIYCID